MGCVAFASSAYRSEFRLRYQFAAVGAPLRGEPTSRAVSAVYLARASLVLGGRSMGSVPTVRTRTFGWNRSSVNRYYWTRSMLRGAEGV